MYFTPDFINKSINLKWNTSEVWSDINDNNIYLSQLLNVRRSSVKTVPILRHLVTSVHLYV